MKPLEFVSASQFSVRLRTSDADGPIIVAVRRAAIEDRFNLSSSTEKLRIEVVMANLSAIADLVRARIARRQWTQGVGASPRQIVIRLKELNNVPLQGPG
jgi:hypothetical protein